jgi:hypothetical protein
VFPLRPEFANVGKERRWGATKLTKAENLEAARKEFIPFSNAASEFARMVRQESDAMRSIKVFKRSMAPKPGQTSFWIQLQGSLHNPFYGSEMIDCGSEVTP